MQSVAKLMGAAAMALALTGALSACGSKAAQTPDDIETYLAENPYHEQSKAEQATSLNRYAKALNKHAKTDNRYINNDISGRFSANASRDMIIFDGTVKRSVTPKQLKLVRQDLKDNRFAEKYCQAPEINGLNQLGIGFEIIVKTKAGDLLDKATCPGVSAELYALESGLIDTPYETRTEAQKAEVIQSFVAELNKDLAELNKNKVGDKVFASLNYEADVSRGVIVSRITFHKVLSVKNTKARKAEFAADKRYIDLCKNKEILKFTSHGFRYQAILQDAANDIYYKSDICRPKTPEMYRIEAALSKTPYTQLSRGQRAKTLKALAKELAHGQQALEAIEYGTHKIVYEANVEKDMLIQYAVLNKSISEKMTSETSDKIKVLKTHFNQLKELTDFCTQKDAISLTRYGIKTQLFLQDHLNAIIYQSDVCSAKTSMPKLRGRKS